MAYLRHFGLGLVALAVLSGAATLAIDPYDIFGAPRVTGWNDVKTPGDPRFAKPLQVAQRRPSVVFLGTSRVEVGLDPAAVPGAYNFGIPGLVAPELRAFGAHALATAPVKRLVIGLDLPTFNDAHPPPPAFSSAVLGPHALLRSIPATLFSLDALDRARKCLRRSWKGKAGRRRADGFYLLPEDGAPTESVLRSAIASYVGPGGRYRGLESISRSLADYEALLEQARAKGVTVDAFLSPAHAALVEVVALTGRWSLYEEWKRALVRISERHGATLWDFGGYTPLTTVPLASARDTYIDLIHYRPAVGRRILAAMAGGDAADGIGVRLRTDTIEATLAQERRARDAYRTRRADDVARVAAIVAAVTGRTPGS